MWASKTSGFQIDGKDYAAKSGSFALFEVTRGMYSFTTQDQARFNSTVKFFDEQILRITQNASDLQYEWHVSEDYDYKSMSLGFKKSCNTVTAAMAAVRTNTSKGELPKIKIGLDGIKLVHDLSDLYLDRGANCYIDFPIVLLNSSGPWSHPN